MDDPKDLSPPGDKSKVPLDPPHYHGHRKRLRDKLLANGGEHFPDYELLELLLMMVTPRRDVKPLAKSLLNRFGGFAEVITADPLLLAREKGLGDTALAAIKIVQAAAVRLLKDRIMDRPIIQTWEHVLDYCVAAMGRDTNEQFRVLYLDARSHLIADEMQQRGTIDKTPVYPREVLRRALELGAASFVIVHNHPSGDPTPSKSDIEMTRTLCTAAKALNVKVFDHVIIGRTTYISFKHKGLLD